MKVKYVPDTRVLIEAGSRSS